MVTGIREDQGLASDGGKWITIINLRGGYLNFQIVFPLLDAGIKALIGNKC